MVGRNSAGQGNWTVCSGNKLRHVGGRGGVAHGVECGACAWYSGPDRNTAGMIAIYAGRVVSVTALFPRIVWRYVCV